MNRMSKKTYTLSQLAACESVKDCVHALARQHGVVYVSSPLDRFAEAITRVCGDDVELDETQDLLIALVRAGIIRKEDLVFIHARYLSEKYQDKPPLRIDKDELIAAVNKESNLPFSSALNPSPFLFESSQTPGCVDRVDAEGNRVTGKLDDDGHFIAE